MGLFGSEMRMFAHNTCSYSLWLYAICCGIRLHATVESCNVMCHTYYVLQNMVPSVVAKSGRCFILTKFAAVTVWHGGLAREDGCHLELCANITSIVMTSGKPLYNAQLPMLMVTLQQPAAPCLSALVQSPLQVQHYGLGAARVAQVDVVEVCICFVIDSCFPLIVMIACDVAQLHQGSAMVSL